MSTTVIVCLSIAVVLLLGGVSIAAAFGLAALAIAYFLDIGLEAVFSTMISRIDSPTLVALPLFIYMGMLAETSGQGERLVRFVEVFLGRFKSGLGVVIVAACALFGAISGAGSAAIAAIGTVLLPRAKAAGYPEGYLVALLACSSILTLLIPPSIPMLILALTMQISVGGAFLTTLLPGLVIVAGYVVVNYFCARKFPIQSSGEHETVAFSTRLRREMRSSFWVLLLPVVVLGGIYGGIASPTEAAGLGAVYVIVLGFVIYRSMSFRQFFGATMAMANLLGALIIMIASLMLLSTVLVYEGTPFALADYISTSFESWRAMLVINVILLIIGMIMDDISGSIVAASVLYPVAQNLGVEPLHFAAIVGVNLGLGNITPPVAPLLFMSGAVAGNVPMHKYLGHVMRFILLVNVPVLLLVTYFPSFSLWLPRQLGYL